MKDLRNIMSWPQLLPTAIVMLQGLIPTLRDEIAEILTKQYGFILSSSSENDPDQNFKNAHSIKLYLNSKVISFLTVDDHNKNNRLPCSIDYCRNASGGEIIHALRGNRKNDSVFITPDQASTLIKRACNSWKKKLIEEFDPVKIIEGNKITVTRQFYNRMKAAAVGPQNQLLDVIFHDKFEDNNDDSYAGYSSFDVMMKSDSFIGMSWGGSRFMVVKHGDLKGSIVSPKYTYATSDQMDNHPNRYACKDNYKAFATSKDLLNWMAERP